MKFGPCFCQNSRTTNVQDILVRRYCGGCLGCDCLFIPNFSPCKFRVLITVECRSWFGVLATAHCIIIKERNRIQGEERVILVANDKTDVNMLSLILFCKCIARSGKLNFHSTGNFMSSCVFAIPRLYPLTKYCLDTEHGVHGSVHHNTNLVEMTNEMQLRRTIYYSIVPWLLNMFRAILSLIIRSFLTVIIASSFTV
jgi:hypothetical protein